MSYTIETRDEPAQPTATIRVQTPTEAMTSVMDTGWPEVWGYLESAGVHPSGPPFIRYHHVDPEQADIEVGFPVPAPVGGAGRVAAGELPGGTVAVTDHFGSYDMLPAAYAALAQWLEAQGHNPMETAPWTIYWTDPGEEPDQGKWRAEIIWPLAARAERG
jgi:effector-binding domain-containing protein